MNHVSDRNGRGFALSRRTDLEAIARRAQKLLSAIDLGSSKANVSDLVESLRDALEDAQEPERFDGGSDVEAMILELANALKDGTPEATRRKARIRGIEFLQGKTVA